VTGVKRHSALLAFSALQLLSPLLIAASATACGDRSIFADPERAPLSRPDSGAVDAAPDVELNDSAGFQDALPDAVGDACSTSNEPGPLLHLCVPLTDNECDGLSDPDRFLPNGAFGNGFDDDCDGLVDERCPCGPGRNVGATRTCWLVPSTQAELETSLPVGWCREHSRGLVTCIREGGGDTTRLTWDGQCAGAEQPFADDVCAPGDFDCDGRVANSRSGNCTCGD
jgi:hypothetical protein